jgi:tripartite-type tricarboxylate transporter receptor subunit TctC
MDRTMVSSAARKHRKDEAMNCLRTIAAAIAVTCSIASGNAVEQPYPNRLVTLIVPTPAGGTPDILARLVVDKLRASIGQDVVVDNRPGAGGIIGAESAARAAQDGRVLLCAVEWLFLSHLMHSKLSFDPHAFEPVGVIAKYPLVLIGRKDLPVSNIAELIPYARQHPGKLTFASSGIGSMHQLVYEDIKRQAGINLTHVPYRGGSPQFVNDMLAGHVDLSLTPLGNGAPYVRDGKLKLLGILGNARLAEFPDAPTVSEVLPGLETEGWTGIVAPPRTPRDVTSKLSRAVADVLQMPDVRERILGLQAIPVGNTPDQMRRVIQSDTERWEPVIRAARISID